MTNEFSLEKQPSSELGTGLGQATRVVSHASKAILYNPSHLHRPTDKTLKEQCQDCRIDIEEAA